MHFDNLCQWEFLARENFKGQQGGSHIEISQLYRQLLRRPDSLGRLDSLYQTVLCHTFYETDQGVMKHFRQVLGLSLAAAESISLETLNNLWRFVEYPEERVDEEDVGTIAHQWGFLLTGITDEKKPIHVLQFSFRGSKETREWPSVISSSI